VDKDLQDSLIDTIQILVDEVIKKTPYTSSQIGKVKAINGFDCIVEIYGSDTECKLLEHLQTSIKVGDIVIVQDLFNSNVKRFIQAKIGETPV
jgi:hypothetical protein